MAAGAWIVLCRDVSESLQVDGLERVWLSLILDADTGLALATMPGSSQQEALEGACVAAAASTLGDAPSAGRPAQVWVRTTLVPAVTTAVAAVLSDPPPVIASGVIAEAEDIFDSMIQTLGGRPFVADLPSTEQWHALYDELARFAAQEPWQRLDDNDPLHVQLTVDDQRSDWAAIVMGSAGIQLGLAAYPGLTLPTALSAPTGRIEEAIVPGSFLVFFDDAGQLPSDVIDKALRHGWPDELDVFPHCVTVDETGQPGSLDATTATVLHGLLSAVRQHDERYDEKPSGTGLVTRGRQTGAAGEQVSFTVRNAAPAARRPPRRKPTG
jgi:hypothetical protein